MMDRIDTRYHTFTEAAALATLDALNDYKLAVMIGPDEEPRVCEVLSLKVDRKSKLLIADCY